MKLEPFALERWMTTYEQHVRFEHHLRLGIGQEPQIFAEGLARTASCLTALRK
jgi:hypothetical protein